MTNEISVGARIMLLRTERGFSRETMAELTGISAKFLYEIENDRKGFSSHTLQRMAEVLEVSLDYIMTGQGARRYDDEIFKTIYRFKPGTLEAVDALLKTAYRLTMEH